MSSKQLLSVELKLPKFQKKTKSLSGEKIAKRWNKQIMFVVFFNSLSLWKANVHKTVYKVGAIALFKKRKAFVGDF